MSNTETNNNICRVCRKKPPTKKLTVFLCDDDFPKGFDGLVELVRRLRNELEAANTNNATTVTPTPTPTPTAPLPPTPVIQQPPQTAEPIETYETLIHKLVNQARVQQGLKELTYNDTLAQVAENHSIAMQQKAFFAHTDPYSKLTATERVRKAGHPYGWVGENIAKFSTSKMSTLSKQQVAQHLFDQWWASPAHKENMLNKNFTMEGLGVWVFGNECWGTQDLAEK